MVPSRFFSPGKFLLTSEYMVLDGALALAVPTVPGQELFVTEEQSAENQIVWNAFHSDKLWLSVTVNFKNWEIISTNLPDSAAFVLKLLKIIQQDSGKFRSGYSYSFKTVLQFPADYGLGSSSTLINNLAQWAGMDPFSLNEAALGGSGYDIAVAQQKKAITYQLTEKGRSYLPVTYNPSFYSELLFVHLNRKQDSREGIRLYRSLEKNSSVIRFFSDLTEKIIAAETLSDFSKLMETHEHRLGCFLGLQPVKERLFPDIPVFVKSLGAWGGDFVLTSKFPGYETYFREKGFETLLGWEDLIG